MRLFCFREAEAGGRVKRTWRQLLWRQVDYPRVAAGARANTYGKIAKTRAGKPEPSLGLGNVTITRAPASDTLSRLVNSSIW